MNITLIKQIFIISLIVFFFIISLTYMLAVFGHDILTGFMQWLSSYIFIGTIILNVINTIVEKNTSSSKGAQDVPGSKSQKGGTNETKPNFKEYKKNFFEDSYTNCGTYISDFFDKGLRGILTMGGIYLIAATCLSFVDIIISSDSGESCSSVGNLSIFIENLTKDPFKSLLFWFGVFTLILIGLGRFDIYYKGRGVGKFSSYLPRIRDKIIAFFSSVIDPIISALIGIYVIKEVFTDNIIKFLNSGSVTTISDNVINKIMSILILVISIILIILLFRGAYKFIAEITKSGEIAYENIADPIFGEKGWFRKAESKASMCNIKPYWDGWKKEMNIPSKLRTGPAVKLR